MAWSSLTDYAVKGDWRAYYSRGNIVQWNERWFDVGMQNEEYGCLPIYIVKSEGSVQTCGSAEGPL